MEIVKAIEIPKRKTSIPESGESFEDISLAFDAAVAAPEKQIPKKPVEYEDKYYGCPNCDNPLMHKWGGKYPTRLNDKKNGLPYCLACGQAIDWE